MNNLQGNVLFAQYQGYLRCHFCDTPVLLLYFDVCHINLCKGCAANHLLDDSVEHKVVPIRQKHLLICIINLHHMPKNQCELHEEHCELYCKQCDFPICRWCLSNSQRLVHDTFGTTDAFKSNTDNFYRYLQEV